MRKNERGSMTLEACIVVPIFVSLMLFVNGFFIYFMGQQVLSNALVQSAKSLAYDPYAVDRAVDDDSNFIQQIIPMLYDVLNAGGGNYVSSEAWYLDENIEEAVKERFLVYVSPTDADKVLKVFGIKNGSAGLDFSESTVEDDVLCIKIKYTQEFVFNTMNLASFDDSMQVKVKLFRYLTVEE